MTASSQKQIFLKDYRAPDFEIQTTELWFDLHETKTIVRAKLRVQKKSLTSTLVLNGEDIVLKTVSVDGKLLSPSQYEVDEKNLSIPLCPDQFILETTVELNPSANTQLSGLYLSSGKLTTQCEAEGFRRITYYLDRPDVMATFRVHIRADQKKFPVLLSNGNRSDARRNAEGSHEITFDDPFKKPCYLFALVAGDLAVINDRFQTMSGRTVGLEIYAEHETIGRCHHAMESLKRSFRWDEERFGREYDLDTFMIVAMSDFNSGAMENKGLNIFNARLLLADPATATDRDYFLIESVIGHEYFHNWSGNRVTLRDWFHLSLKEGLTVFRDQEFSMDLHSASQVRIDNVEELRDRQFAEDAGPNAHPIRPESCYAVDNFYTSTIYEKGSEVIRMMQTIVGRPGFRRGMDLYFKRHDGQAVIIEDFARAISDANQIDLTQFRLWYSQAGTPTLRLDEKFDPQKNELRLKLTQSCEKTFREQEHPDFEKRPFVLPLEMALFDSNGEVPLQHPRIHKNSEGKQVLILSETSEELVIPDLRSRPVVSINRQFSAPVKLDRELTIDDLFILFEKESDAFSQWEAGQKIFERLLLDRSSSTDIRGETLNRLAESLSQMIANPQTDLNVLAKILSPPSDSWLAQNDGVFDGAFYFRSRRNLMRELATRLKDDFVSLIGRFSSVPAAWSQETMSKRALKNRALHFLSSLGDEFSKLSWDQFQNAQIMTDLQSSFETLVEVDRYRDQVTERFFEKWKHDALVMNKWFSIQALAAHPHTFETVQKLWTHPNFDVRNPNRVYSLLLRFGMNLSQFHAGQSTQKTYQWAADRLAEIDAINPLVAARVSSLFNFCKNVDSADKRAAASVLGELLKTKLSPNTFEILSTTYKDLQLSESK